MLKKHTNALITIYCVHNLVIMWSSLFTFVYIRSHMTSHPSAWRSGLPKNFKVYNYYIWCDLQHGNVHLGVRGNIAEQL